MTINVLIIDDRPQRSQRLEQALAAAGFTVLAVIDGEERLHEQVASLAPDVILVDTELPGRDTLEHFASLGECNPKPLIMLGQSVDSDLTLRAAQAGVTAYAVQTLDPVALRSLIEVGIAHFRAHTELRAELTRARQTLSPRGGEVPEADGGHAQ